MTISIATRSKISVSKILTSDVSDHLPTICIMKSSIHKSFTPGLMVRNMKKFNAEAFSEDVNSRLEDLSRSLNDDSITEVNKILSAITKVTNFHAPL